MAQHQEFAATACHLTGQLCLTAALLLHPAAQTCQTTSHHALRTLSALSISSIRLKGAAAASRHMISQLLRSHSHVRRANAVRSLRYGRGNCDILFSGALGCCVTRDAFVILFYSANEAWSSHWTLASSNQCFIEGKSAQPTPSIAFVRLCCDTISAQTPQQVLGPCGSIMFQHCARRCQSDAPGSELAVIH